MKTVVILRGLPGCGKSTVMGLLYPCAIVSMDLFWTRGGKRYKFDYTKLEEAIQWTHQQFLDYLDSADIYHPKIVVDNVSYAWDHYKFFYEEAKKRGCMVHVIHVERRMDELQSSHGVSPEKIAQMASKWEPHR